MASSTKSDFTLSGDAEDSARSQSMSFTISSPPRPKEAPVSTVQASKNAAASSPKRTQAPLGAGPPAKQPQGSSRSELSFSASGSKGASAAAAAPPLPTIAAVISVELEHELHMENMTRVGILDEESAVRQHFIRLHSMSKTRLEAEKRLQEAKRKESLPQDSSAANVDPLMVDYLKHLKASKSNKDDVERLRTEREKLAEELKRHEAKAQTLSQEAAARTTYTAEVAARVAKQEAKRAEETHDRVVEAHQRQESAIRAAVAAKQERMANDRDARLKQLRVNHAFIALHGNHEERVRAGDMLREIRLERVKHKVVTQHTPEAIAAAQDVHERVRAQSKRRREEAEAVAAATSLRMFERLEARSKMIGEARQRERKFDDEDRAEKAKVHREIQQAAEYADNVDRTREREAFLNRMTCNEEFNTELNALRDARLRQQRELWEQRTCAAKEKHSVADKVASLEKQNEGKLRVLDRLMAEEALTITRAKERMTNRQRVERRMEERIVAMENEERNKVKILEALYAAASTSHHPSPSRSDDTSHAIAPHSQSHHVDSRNASNHEGVSLPLVVGAHGGHQGPHSTTSTSSPQRSRLFVEQELREREKKIAQCYPPRRDVLPHAAHDPTHRTMAFPTAAMLRHPTTTNAAILAEARKIFELEHSEQPQHQADDASEHSRERERRDRDVIRQRLTQPSMAAEARRVLGAHEVTSTIHDHVPKQVGVNERLYKPPLGAGGSRQAAATIGAGAGAVPGSTDELDENAELNLRAFVHRFYAGPIAKLEQSHLVALRKVMHDCPGAKPVRCTDREIGGIVQRLYQSPTKHISSETERRLDEQQNQRKGTGARLSTAEMARRFYTEPLQKQKSLAEDLDRKFL